LYHVSCIAANLMAKKDSNGTVKKHDSKLPPGHFIDYPVEPFGTEADVEEFKALLAKAKKRRELKEGASSSRSQPK
jgi:hypothetical protein